VFYTYDTLYMICTHTW